jgi:hypothetical protein
MLLIFDAVVHVGSVRQFVSITASALVAGLSEDKALELIPGALFFLYVLIGETWVWTMRMRTRREILVIDRLDSIYSISARKAGEEAATGIG